MGLRDWILIHRGYPSYQPVSSIINTFPARQIIDPAPGHRRAYVYDGHVSTCKIIRQIISVKSIV